MRNLIRISISKIIHTQIQIEGARHIVYKYLLFVLQMEV